MDKICLEGMIFYGYHGANPAERELGQRFVVDLDVECDLRTPGSTDRLEDTVSYSHLYQKVKAVLEGPGRNLLEALGEDVCRSVLDAFPMVQGVRVIIHKPAAPIRGAALAAASVEVYRRRE